MMLFGAAIEWHSVFFTLFSLLACVFAAAVLFTSNIVRMAFYLTLSLGAVAGLFFLSGAEFVGAMQLMIYVGGTLVLLIFGVMLTAQSRFVTMATRPGEWALALIVGGALLGLLMQVSFGVADWRTPNPHRSELTAQDGQTTTLIGARLIGIPIDRADQPNERLRAGMSGYFLPFVIVSVHLLVVLIGAAYMARTKRRSETQLSS